MLYATGDPQSAPIFAPAAYRPPRPQASDAQLRQAAELLAKAQRPLVVSGSGVDRGDANAPLLDLVALLNCPVITTMAGRSSVPLALVPQHPRAGPTTHTEGRAISADGSTVVGFGQYSHGDAVVNEAFRWQGGVLLGLGSLRAGDELYSNASDVSANGAVVVGTTRGPGGLQAFRWESGAMTGLGVLPSYQESIGQAITGDGAIVLGRCQNYIDGYEFFTVFVWDRTHGMRRLETVFETDFDFDLDGWSLDDVLGASLDGATIVGSGVNPEGSSESWLARLRPSSP